MAASFRAGSLLLPAACFAVGIAGGHGYARLRTSTPEPVAVDAAAPPQAAGPTNTAGAHAPGAAAVAPLPSAPPGAAAASAAALPPADATVADYYDELLARAQAGDGAAGRRLATDLIECADQGRRFEAVETLLDDRGPAARRRGPQRPQPQRSPSGGEPAFDPDQHRLDVAERMLQIAQQTQKRCAGLQQKAPLDPSELLRNAAVSGDAQAQLCYALASGEWRRDVLSPEWVDWSERWNQESTALLRQSFDNGLPEAALALSLMYTPWQWRESPPWAGRLGDDPYWAYAYGLVARETLDPNLAWRWNKVLLALTQRLDGARVAQAQAWATAARQRIRFRPPANPTPPISLCDAVQHMAGVR